MNKETNEIGFLTKFDIGDKVYCVIRNDCESYMIRKANILGFYITISNCWNTNIDDSNSYEILYSNYAYDNEVDENERYSISNIEGGPVKILTIHTFAKREHLFETQYEALKYAYYELNKDEEEEESE